MDWECDIGIGMGFEEVFEKSCWLDKSFVRSCLMAIIDFCFRSMVLNIFELKYYIVSVLQYLTLSNL